jgi:hypothetical protein
LFLVALVAPACGDDDDGGGDADAAADIDAEVPAGPRPSKRSDTAGVAAPSLGVLAVFGGDDGPIVDQIPSPAYRNDTWVFDPGEGWSEVAGTGPSTRGRHAVALDSTGPRMLVFGGRFRAAGTTGPYTLYNDLWGFDFTARTWSQLDDGAGGPAPRYFAAAAADGAGTFYVYGGGTNTSPTVAQVATDLWMYDGAWSEVTQSGAVPPSRLFAGYTYDASRNRLVIFGGQVGDFVTPARNDLYAVDLATGEWTQLHAGGNGTGVPSGRFSAMLSYDAAGDRYLMTGGHADRGVTNDVWSFDPTGGGWSLARGADTFTGAALGCLGNPQEIPANYVDQDVTAPERRSGGVFEIIGDSAWLFGGESDCSDHLDDTWRYDLAAADWTEILPARSGESCLRRNEDCTCLCL